MRPSVDFDLGGGSGAWLAVAELAAVDPEMAEVSASEREDSD